MAAALLAGLAAGACHRGPEEVTIALVTKAMDSEFWLSVAEGAKAGAAERPGVKLTIVAPDREINVDQQVSILEDQVRRGVKALVVSPAGSAQVMSALELAASRGIPVVLIDTDAPFAKKVSYIGTDNRRGGQLAAKCLVDRLAGRGEVALISGVPGNESQDARAQGFIDAVAQVPGMKLVAQQPANSERSLGLTVMEEAVQATVEGKLAGSVAQTPRAMGQKGVEAALAALDGRAVDKRIDTGTELVTKENSEKYLR